jgi:molybdopterin/thiamine biosynthesis adenylyltransferase
LNPSVRGSFAARSFNTSSALSALNEFSLVVGVRVQLDVAEYIADYLFERNIPFVWTTSVGFVGYFRLSYREHEVLHDHKEASPHDFRFVQYLSHLIIFF